MPDKLCILTCANFEPELRAVLNLEEFNDVTGAYFPSTCGRPPMTWESIGQIIRDLGDFAKIHVMGCCCLREMVNPPEALSHTVIHRMAQCFDLVAAPLHRRISQKWPLHSDFRSGATMATMVG